MGNAVKVGICGTCVIFSGLALAGGCEASNKGATVIVSRPQVFTREHLVQERFRETQWLLNQLNTDAPFTLQGSVDRRVSEVFAEVLSARLGLGRGPTKGSAYTAQPSVDSSGASLAIPLSTATGANPTTLPSSVTSVELFRDKLALRNAINDAIHETELDDTHDLNGYVLCNLQIEVTLLPGKNENRYAIVNTLLSDGYKRTAEEELVQSKFDALSLAQRRVIDRAEASGESKKIAKTILTAIDSLKAGHQLSAEQSEAIWNAHFRWTYEDAQALRRASIKAKAQEEEDAKLFARWTDHVSEEVLLAEIAAEVRGDQEGGVQYLLATIRPKLEAERDVLKRIVDGHEKNSLKTLELTGTEQQYVPAGLSLSAQTDDTLARIATSAQKSLDQVEKKLGELDKANKSLDDAQKKKLIHLLIATQVERKYQNALGLYLDFGTLSEVTVNAGTYYVSTLVKPSINGTRAFGEWKRSQPVQPYVVSIQPKEYAQNIGDFSQKSEATNLALSISAALSGASIENSTQYIKKSLATLQAIQRKPLAIGFSDDASFGWLLGPKFEIAPNGEAKFSQVPVRQSFSVAVAVPAWWSELTINTNWHWLSDDGKTTRPNLDQVLKGETVRLPSRMDGLTAAITSASQMGDTAIQFAPQIQSVTAAKKADFTDPERLSSSGIASALSPVYVQAGTTTSVMIRGRNLWRNPAVYIGGQKAASVEIHPDMQGISATFSNLQAPYDASAAEKKRVNDAQEASISRAADLSLARKEQDDAAKELSDAENALSASQAAHAELNRKAALAMEVLKRSEDWIIGLKERPPLLTPVAGDLVASTQPSNQEPTWPPRQKGGTTLPATNPTQSSQSVVLTDGDFSKQFYWYDSYVKTHSLAKKAIDEIEKNTNAIDADTERRDRAKRRLDYAEPRLKTAESEKEKADRDRLEKEGAEAKAKSSYSATTLTVVTTYGSDSLSNVIAVVAGGDSLSSRKSGFSISTASSVVTENSDGTATIKVIVKKSADSTSKSLSLSIGGADSEIKAVTDTNGKALADFSKYVTISDGGYKVLDSCVIEFALKNVRVEVAISGDDGGLKIGPLNLQRQGTRR